MGLTSIERAQLDRIEGMVHAIYDHLQIGKEQLRLDTAKIDQLREQIGFAFGGPSTPDLVDLMTMAGAVPGIPLPPPRDPGSAHLIHGYLPDADVTPGATNPDVTEETIKATIGTPGWTATVRPPVAYTNALKRIQMKWYGLAGSLDDYEEDHLVPLCCGGHPTDHRNLWPQARTGQWSARVKDLTEVAAQHAILIGEMTLESVQGWFQHDWTTLHDDLFRNPKVVTAMMAGEPPHDEP